MIHVIATISLTPGTRDAYLAEIRKLVPLVRAEAGCIEYGPCIDAASGLDAQPAPRADAVVMLERWESLDALRAHLATPHMAAYREHVKEMVTGLQLQVLEPA